MVLSWGDAKVPANKHEAFAALDTTVDFWRDWLSSAKIPDHPWKPYLDRSALTLKGLSYAPTGAIMAASTEFTTESSGASRFASWYSAIAASYLCCWCKTRPRLL